MGKQKTVEEQVYIPSTDLDLELIVLSNSKGKFKHKQRTLSLSGVHSLCVVTGYVFGSSDFEGVFHFSLTGPAHLLAPIVQ